MCAANYDFTDQEQSKKARMLVKGKQDIRNPIEDKADESTRYRKNNSTLLRNKRRR